MLAKRRIVKNSGIEIINPLEEEISIIKNALTFDNPKYAQIKRFSKWANTRCPRYLTYYDSYTDGKDFVLRVPYGFNLRKHIKRNFFSYKEYFDNKVTFPKFLLELREDQFKASESFMKDKHGIIILPTGKGKSILGIKIASLLSVRTLVIVHKNDLVTGWQKDAKLCFGSDYKTGLIKAQKKDIQPLTIATVQTLSRMSTEELAEYTDKFDLVIQDECHRTPAPTFAMVDKFCAKYKLGLTATLERSDGLAHMIPLYFGEVVYEYERTEEETDILPVEVYQRHLKTEYDPVFNSIFIPAKYNSSGALVVKPHLSLTLTDLKEPVEESQYRLSSLLGESKKFEDYSYSHLDTDSVMCQETIDTVINDIISEFSQGHSCVVFFSQKSHLEEYYKFLLDGKINPKSIVTYYGDNSDAENEQALQKAENRVALITLTTYSKASEGTNCKSWEVAFLVSSVADGKKVEQAVGRIRRVKEGKLKTARLYDYCYDNYVSLDNQVSKRKARYRKLGFSIHNEKETSKRSSLFSVGYAIRKS